MPYLLSNSCYLGIVLLSLLFLDCGTSFLREGKAEISEKIESKSEPQPAAESQVNQSPLVYINSLPAFKLVLQQQRQPKLDTGITAKMLQAELDYIESLTAILVTLANYYSPKHFDNQTPQEFISHIIESRFQWYNAVVEPLGPGTGGSIVLLSSAGGVASDVEGMIEDMVFHLHIVTDWGNNFNYGKWKKAWHNRDF